jgi:hypothetical protein
LFGARREQGDCSTNPNRPENDKQNSGGEIRERGIDLATDHQLPDSRSGAFRDHLSDKKDDNRDQNFYAVNNRVLLNKRKDIHPEKTPSFAWNR